MTRRGKAAACAALQAVHLLGATPLSEPGLVQDLPPALDTFNDTCIRNQSRNPDRQHAEKIQQIVNQAKARCPPGAGHAVPWCAGVCLCTGLYGPARGWTMAGAGGHS